MTIMATYQRAKSFNNELDMQRKIETFIKLNNIKQKNVVEKFDLSQTLLGIIIVENMLKGIDVEINFSKEKLQLVKNKLKLRYEKIKKTQIVRELLADFNTEEPQIKLTEKNRIDSMRCDIKNINAYYIKLKHEINSLIIKRSNLFEFLIILKYHQYQFINELQNDLIKKINELEKEIREIEELQPRLDLKPTSYQQGLLFKLQRGDIPQSIVPTQYLIAHAPRLLTALRRR